VVRAFGCVAAFGLALDKEGTIRDSQPAAMSLQLNCSSDLHYQQSGTVSNANKVHFDSISDFGSMMYAVKGIQWNGGLA
jgi:hypothetical protein